MKKDESLIVSEIFYSMQGEGQTMGIPSVFLRLGGCNLLCEGSGWRCDSIEVWMKGKSTIFQEVLNEEYIKNLRQGAHLVITGGEPMIHQNSIIKYLEYFVEAHKFKPIIEIETNGTINPDKRLVENWVNFWNCSPKLSTSGELFSKRFNPESLLSLNQIKSTIFKFVISCKEDIEELKTDFSICDRKKIVLMPAGDSQQKLKKIRKTVARIALDEGFRYSERLHVMIWNKKTGV